jgi:hypothetical protein
MEILLYWKKMEVINTALPSSTRVCGTDEQSQIRFRSFWVLIPVGDSIFVKNSIINKKTKNAETGWLPFRRGHSIFLITTTGIYCGGMYPGKGG